MHEAAVDKALANDAYNEAVHSTLQTIGQLFSEMATHRQLSANTEPMSYPVARRLERLHHVLAHEARISDECPGLEEEVEMALCQAVIDPFGCYSAPVDSWNVPWCEKHAKQERASYHSYKLAGAMCKSHKELLDLDKTPNNVEDKRKALCYHLFEIVAREAHRHWFYPGEDCEGHIAWETKLVNERAGDRDALWTMDYGIHFIITEDSLREVLRNILTTIKVDQDINVLRG
ncbi:hypothetical protein PG993_003911 [Apiospora rasikravindrae]|uniref:Uncharacterized protein n=1 Tax=Apiospora rasikravindrae TaxID=990691 RepID=A0ABR1U0V3_9PEZI